MNLNIFIFKIDYKNFTWDIKDSQKIGENKITNKQNKKMHEIKTNKKLNEFLNMYSFENIYSHIDNKKYFDNKQINYLNSNEFDKKINSSENNFIIYNCFNSSFISSSNLINDLCNNLGDSPYITIPSTGTWEISSEITDASVNNKEQIRIYNEYLKDDLNVYDEFSFQNTTFLLVNKNYLKDYPINTKLYASTITLIDWYYKLRSSSIKSNTIMNHLIRWGNYSPHVHMSKVINTYISRNWSAEYLHSDDFYNSASLQFSDFVNRKRIKSLDINSNESILYLTTPFDWINGMTKHVRDLIKNIRDKHIYVLDTSTNPRFLSKYTLYRFYNNVLIDINFYYIPSGTSIAEQNDSAYLDIFEKILIENKIGLVHSQISSFGHSPKFVDVCEKLNIKSYISLHDLYYLGGEYTQIDVSKQFDDEILKEKYNIYNLENFKKQWTKNIQNMFNKVDKIISFNDKYFDILSKFYSLDRDKYTIIEHGSNFEKRYNLANPKIDKDLRLIYFGRIREEKGLSTLIKLAQSRKNYKIYIAGSRDDYKLFTKLVELKNIYYLGSYSSIDGLIPLIEKANPHLMIIPANWEEAFNYTLSESYIFGLPPIVSKLGALESRTIKNNAGFMYETELKFDEKDGIKYPKNISSLLTKLENISKLNNEEWLKNINEITNVKVLTNEEMITKYLDLYDIKKIDTGKIKVNNYVYQTAFLNRKQNNYVEKQHKIKEILNDKFKTQKHIPRFMYSISEKIKAKL